MTHNLFRLTYCAIVRMKHSNHYKARNRQGNMSTLMSSEKTSRIFADLSLAYMRIGKLNPVYFADSVSTFIRVTTTPLSYAMRGV